MRDRLLLGTGMIMVAGLLAPAGAYAADKDSAAAETTAQAPDSPEIIVTAAKREQRLQDVPASIVAESALDLQHRGATTLRDIIDNTPGLTNPVAGPRNSANITIRGVTTGTNTGIRQNTVQQLYDDIPLDPTSNAGSTNLRLVDIERVEVLRGPQGTLFGSGSLAGAIRYVTAKPNLNEVSGSLEGSVAGVSKGGVSDSGTGTFNLPIVPGKLALRASGYAYNDAGWVDSLKTGKKDINGTDTYGGRVMVRWQPDSALTVDLSGIYQESTDNSAGASLYSGSGSNQVTDSRTEARFHGRNALVGLNIRYDAGPVSIVSQSAYHDRKYNYRGTVDYYVPLITGIVSGFRNVQPGTTNEFSPNNAQVFTQELRLASNGKGPFRWTAGFFYLHADITAGQFSRSPDLVAYLGNDNVVDLNIKGSQEEIAGFGDVSYTLWNKLDLSAGVRVSSVDLKNTTVTGGFLPVFSFAQSAYVTQNFTESNTPVTPHFSVTYRPTPDLSIYATAARGYRVGGINVTSGVGGRNTPRTYGPDSLWNYELGVKGKLADGRVNYAADFYYIDWSNIQVSLQNQIGNYTGNAGKARLYGVEFELNARPTEAVTLGLSFSLARNEVAQRVDGLGTATGVISVLPGQLLAGSSPSQFNSFSEYRFKLFNTRAYIRSSVRYVGPSYTSFNRAGLRFGDYATSDLRAGLEFENYELAVFANNLFDSSGISGAADRTTAGPVLLNSAAAFRIQPRTVGATIRARF